MKPSYVYKKLCLAFLMSMLILSSSGCSKSIERNQSQLEGYPIASDVFTTLQKTIVPDIIPSDSEKIFPYEISKFKQNGYGNWSYGPGLDSVKRLDIMPTNYTGASATNSTRLLNFFAMTDIHITDKETPAQAIYYGYKGGTSSGYSPVMLYSTQVLDAAVQTINAIHKENPFDFGISLGDTINSAQHNELRWYIDVLDGKNITPDSGVKDDPVPGPYNDYQDEYKAAGLDKTINWYQTLGNHDHFWIGTNPLNDYLRQAYIGENILNLGDIFTDPLGIDSRGFYMGSIDGRTLYGDIIGVGPVKDFPIPPKVLAADSNRRSISRNEWISEFLNTSSSPKGHGFNQSNVETGFACYTFEPKSNIPIKVIVLDDTQRDDDPDIGGYGHGSLDQERYEWLIKELDMGQAEDKLMIIAAHIPISVTTGGLLGPFMTWSSVASVSEENLTAILHTYPNLILWISGHRHFNTITALKSPDVARPELGFWEIETSSLRDFPQQFRTFEIVRNSDNTVSIFATDVDPAVKDGSFAATSRSYAVAAQQIFNNTIDLLPMGSYNAELVKQLSPEMQAKMQNYGGLMGTSGTTKLADTAAQQYPTVSFNATPVQYAQVNGVTLGYREFGSGEPLLMVTGFGNTIGDWNETFIGILATKYHVFTYDHRGMGYSSDNNATPSISRYADDAAQLMTALGYDSMNVYGVSMGSSVSQQLVIDHPERVRKLVLDSTSYSIRIPETKKLLGSIVAAAANPTLSDGIHKEAKANLAWNGSYDGLSGIQKDVMLVVGTKDVLTPDPVSVQIAGQINGSWLVRFKGLPHVGSHYAPVEYGENALTFLSMDESPLSK